MLCNSYMYQAGLILKYDIVLCDSTWHKIIHKKKGEYTEQPNSLNKTMVMYTRWIDLNNWEILFSQRIQYRNQAQCEISGIHWTNWPLNEIAPWCNTEVVTKHRSKLYLNIWENALHVSTWHTITCTKTKEIILNNLIL